MSQDNEITPRQVLRELEEKLTALAYEYANGDINAPQYNALYRHYNEKRALIEHIADTNPDNPTWRTVAEQDDSQLLRQQFESRLDYCAVFQRGSQTPLLTEGKLPRNVAEQLLKLLQSMWEAKTWRKGVAGKSLGEGMWLVLTMGEQGMTLAVFYLQPSRQQMHHVRDVHKDFEQANQSLLKKRVTTGRLVFPQRSLVEK